MPAGSFLQIAGELLDEALLQEVTLIQELNNHSWCDVVCRETMDKRFPSENLLGQTLTVSTVDEQGGTLDLFTGFILESELEYEIFGSQTARLRAVSQSYSMDATPRRKYYFQKSPQDVAQELVGTAGLKLAGTIDGQKLSFVQMEETDFRFLLRFVDESEKWLRPTDSGVEVQSAFQPGTTLSWRSEYGLVQFHTTGKLGARQLAGSHYDYRKMQSEVLSNVQDGPELYASSAKMTAAVKTQSAKLGKGFVTTRDRLLGTDDLSPRLQKESRRSTGKMVLCRGVSREQRLKAGDEVTVDGVLDANGTYGLVRVEHRWTVNGYENDFLCTPWKRYTTGEAIPVPRFDGVVPARVADNNDPEGIGRIQVQYYWQEDSFTCWIRAMTPHAGADRGVFCLPEIGDEVWVMFEEGDPERGRILGAAWNGKMQPPREELWGGDVGPNDVKRMVTKSGHRISLDDKPGKNAIVVATPEHVKVSMMESSNETGDAMLALHSDGDVFLSAPAGRIHFHSKFWSREVGGGGSAPAAPAGTTKASWLSEFGSGLADSTYRPLVQMVSHPIDTGKGIGHAIVHPIDTLKAAGTGIVNTGKGIITGDPKAIGIAIGTIGMALVPGAEEAEGAEAASDAEKLVSPAIHPSEIAGKTPVEIDSIAREKGLIPKGPDPMNGRGAYIDPVTQQQRILSHPSAQPAHAHVNNPAGERLGVDGNVVPKESPEAHLPIKTKEQ